MLKNQDGDSDEGQVEEQSAWGLSSIFILVGFFFHFVNLANCREVSLLPTPRKTLGTPSLK